MSLIGQIYKIYVHMHRIVSWVYTFTTGERERERKDILAGQFARSQDLITLLHTVLQQRLHTKNPYYHSFCKQEVPNSELNASLHCLYCQMFSMAAAAGHRFIHVIGKCDH